MRSQVSWQPAGAPDRVQLHMGRALYDGRREVPVPTPPEGFALVQAGAAQASELAEVLGGNGELGEWDSERARRLFDDESADAAVDACFLIVIGDQAVATAQLDAHRRGHYTGLAELGWVAVLPEARGRRLGSLVSQAVLEEAETLGHRQVFLRTDDRRAPAIVSYLRLGFRPWLVEPNASGRWHAALGELDPVSRALGEKGLKDPWVPAGPEWERIDWEAVAGSDRTAPTERGTGGPHTGS